MFGASVRSINIIISDDNNPCIQLRLSLYPVCNITGCDDKWPNISSFRPKPGRSVWPRCCACRTRRLTTPSRPSGSPAMAGRRSAPDAVLSNSYNLPQPCHVALQGLPLPVLGYVRHHLRKPQAFDPQHSRGDCDLHQRCEENICALQLSRDLDVQYKTAFVMAHKLREAMRAEDIGAKVSGEVEVDGMYAGGYVKPANIKALRKDRRLLANQSGKRQSVIVARERNGKTITFAAKSEAAAVPALCTSALPKKAARSTLTFSGKIWDNFPRLSTIPSASIIPRRTAPPMAAPIRPSHSSRGCAARKSARTTISPGRILPPMPLKWIGARIAAGSAMANSLPPSSPPPQSIRSVASGRAIGSGVARNYDAGAGGAATGASGGIANAVPNARPSNTLRGRFVLIVLMLHTIEEAKGAAR